MVSKVKKKPIKMRNSKVKNTFSTYEELRNDFPEITDKELIKLKGDDSYKEGFLLTIRLVTSELKTLIDKN